MVFTSLTSVVGHLYVQDKGVAKQYHERFHLINFAIGCVFYLGYYAIINELVGLLFTPELICEPAIAFVITLNGFVQFMRRSTLTFREATGTFYNDRWKPLLEGLVNVILSVYLVHRMGIVGVIAATVLTNLMICHVIEPYVLYKNAFLSSPVKYYFRNYGFMAVFAASMLLLRKVAVQSDHLIKSLLINGTISVGISLAVCGMAGLLLLKNLKSVKK